MEWREEKKRYETDEESERDNRRCHRHRFFCGTANTTCFALLLSLAQTPATREWNCKWKQQRTSDSVLITMQLNCLRCQPCGCNNGTKNAQQTSTLWLLSFHLVNLRFAQCDTISPKPSLIFCQWIKQNEEQREKSSRRRHDFSIGRTFCVRMQIEKVEKLLSLSKHQHRTGHCELVVVAQVTFVRHSTFTLDHRSLIKNIKMKYSTVELRLLRSERATERKKTFCQLCSLPVMCRDGGGACCPISVFHCHASFAS